MSVAVIGGGWAGLAAAVTLVKQGIPVTLFESAAQLGGRARRVEVNGMVLDNGQHILIGAYRETLRLLAIVGVDVHAACHAPPLTLQVSPNFYLRAAALPAPLHLGLGLLKSRGIPLRDKLSAVRFLAALKRARFSVLPDKAVTTLLARHRQSAALNSYLWHPLCLAALNTPPHLASAQIFVNVLRDAFFGTREDSKLILPRVDLGQLLPDPAAHYISAKGGTVHLNQRIQRVEVTGKEFILHSDHGSASFSKLICAVPPFRVGALLGHLAPLQAMLDKISAFAYQPIYTVYLQYDASQRLLFPMLGLSQGLSQWVFDRGALSGQAGLMAVIISADGEHSALPHATLVKKITHELHVHLGLPAQEKWSQVIAEKRATFSCSPAIMRPDTATPIAGLFLAGDYTASEYPATLESAVRSGIQCALSIQDALK